MPLPNQTNDARPLFVEAFVYRLEKEQSRLFCPDWILDPHTFYRTFVNDIERQLIPSL